MSQWLLIGTAILGLLGLAFYCVPHDSHHIEHDITARSTQAVTSANVAVPDGGLTVSGRDVTLTGPRGSALVSDSTRDMVAKVWGVRDPVHVVVTEPPLTPPVTAPLPLPVEARKLEVDLSKFLEGKNIRFDIGSDVIHPEGQAVLNDVFRILATSPTVSVDITGHTDNEGDERYNVDLSRRRAAAVKNFLAAKGIKAERMETEGFGSTKPVVPNDTPEHMARNRRIEFHATGRTPGGAALKNN